MASIGRLAAAAVLQAFGTSATLWPGTGSAKSVRGVFDRRHRPLGLDGDVVVSGTETVLGLRSADADGVAAGDLVAAGGAIYAVADLQPDSEGWTVLILERRDA